MQRIKAAYPVEKGKISEIKRKMLNWASQFSIFLFLDNNNFSTGYNKYECLLATGTPGDILLYGNEILSCINEYHKTNKDWIFGHICYDYKNCLEPKLSSKYPSKSGFPLIRFFCPQTVCTINAEQTTLTIESFLDPETIYYAILGIDSDSNQPDLPKLSFNYVVDKETYLQTISQLRKHIRDGDCYEINYCCEGFCENVQVNPLEVFRRLNELSPAPFAAFYRLGKQYLMCASPERYLLKTGEKIISQPIKGTARRHSDPEIDLQIKRALQHDQKERAENVMIVDLVRNDLAHTTIPGSIKVEELFGVYTFPQVHQLISTVCGTIQPGTPFTETIRHSFPMGSMTGAPKFKVMQLIEDYEKSRRELFSGTVGYITPSGDFDFNVIIRSLFYNADTHYLSYLTGGAITNDSVPEMEWEEMRLKAWALERIFQ